jgi:hypothetical protein
MHYKRGMKIEWNSMGIFGDSIAAFGSRCITAILLSLPAHGDNQLGLVGLKYVHEDGMTTSGGNLLRRFARAITTIGRGSLACGICVPPVAKGEEKRSAAFEGDVIATWGVAGLKRSREI